MSKYSNKKALISTIVVMVMVLSALFVITSDASAQTATGTFIANVIPSPTSSGGTVLTPLASPAPLIFINGGTTAKFTAGQVVDFYWATGTTVNTIVSGVVGSLYASSTGTISGSFQLTGVPSTPGSYYLLAASEGNTAGGVAASTGTLTVVAQSTYPLSFKLSLDEVTYSTSVTSTVGSTVYFEGSGFTSTTAITIYFVNSSGSSITTFSATSTSGQISGSFTIPAAAMGTYYVIAYDGGSGGGFGTATATVSIVPSVSPVISIPEGSISFSTVTLTGAGFPSTATFAPSTVSSPSNTLTIGGVDAILSSAPTVSSKGAVTFSIVGLASPIITTGPQTVVINDQQGQSWSFPAQAYVSSPTGVPTLVVTDQYTGTNSGYVGDTLVVTAYNMIASTSITVYFNGVTLASGTTDANGFFTGSASVPTLPGMQYSVYAVVSYEYVSTTFKILPLIMITDSAGHPLNGKWAVAGSVVTIAATGLAPFTEYAITDTGLATDNLPTNVAYSYSIYGFPSITSGASSIAPDMMGFLTDGTGSLTVSYSLTYKASTGTTETITFAPGTANATSANYLAVGKVSISGLASSYAPSTSSGYTTVTFTVSGIIPYGQSYTPETYPPVYQVYFGGSLMTLTNGKTTFITTTTSATVSFNIPIGTSTGVYDLAVEAYESGPFVLESTKVIVSSAGAGASIYPASPSTVLPAYPGEPLPYYLYDFPANTAVTVTYYTNLGRQTTSITTDANGAATFVFTVPNAVAGTYELFFTYGKTTVSGTWEYEIPPAVSFDQTPYADNGYSPPTDYSAYFGVDAYPGEAITFYAYSLEPNTVYMYGLSTSSSWSGVMASTESYFVTDQYGNGPASGLSMMLPVLPAGTYYVLFAPYSTTPSAISQYLTVELGGYNVIYSNMNFSSNMVPAFPGQLINFVIPTTGNPSPGASYYEVNILLNGTNYETVQAYYSSSLGGIAGSFQMFNSQPGNWYNITLQYAPVTVTTTTVYDVVGGNTQTSSTQSLPAGTSGTSTTVTGSMIVTVPSGAPSGSFVSQVSNLEYTEASGGGAITGFTWSYVLSGTSAIVSWSFTYTETGTASSYTVTATYSYSYPVTISYQTIGSFKYSGPGATLILVSGNGALLTGITPDEIATLQAQISSTISTSMQVPLSELNASIVAINNAVATIKTAFGNMTATLKAINASVAGIVSGQAILVTDLGTVQTSLANLNATVVGIENNVVLLNTAVGQVQTSLNSLNAKIVAINGTVATIQTDIGTINTSLASINAQLTSIQGNIATIQTSLGTIQASLNSLNAKIVAINGTVATIQTDIGTINTSLASINAQLTSIQGNIATIQTSLGTIQGTVTSINGSVATIKTQLGTLQTSVNGVISSVNAAKSSTSNAVTFEVLIMVLVLITLVVAIGTLLIANRMIKRLEELKKQ